MKEAVSFFRKYKIIPAALIVLVQMVFYKSMSVYWINLSSPSSEILRAVTGRLMSAGDKVFFYLLTAAYFFVFLCLIDYEKKHDVLRQFAAFAAAQLLELAYRNACAGTIWGLYKSFRAKGCSAGASVSGVLSYYNCEIYMLFELLFCIVAAAVISIVIKRRRKNERND